VGGDYSEPALRSIGWEGRYLVVGFPAGIPALPLNLALLKGCDIRGVFWGAAIERDQVRHAQAVVELLAMYASGKIRPSIYRVFEHTEVAQALKLLASRLVQGKVVVTIA
jgi:NADPH2:quinone reductase